jgi:hypothetical protein
VVFSQGWRDLVSEIAAPVGSATIRATDLSTGPPEAVGALDLARLSALQGEANGPARLSAI